MASYNSRKHLASKASLTAAFRDMDEAARLTAGKPGYEQRIDQLRMYTYYLLLREKVKEASITKNKTAIVEAIKNETEFGGRLTYTNMIHSRPLLGKAFDRLFKENEALLKDIPESQTDGKGWRKIGNPATHEELEYLWAQGKKYLGI
jgi:altronate dehydratase